MTSSTDHQTEFAVLHRRGLLLSAGAAALLGPTFLAAAAEEAVPQALERSKQFEEAYAALLAGATPIEGKITLELPEIAENGNFVPLSVTVDNPMADDDYVKTIHILSTSNPVARVASFHLSPINGIARVQSRIRLAKTQDVIAVAVLSGGAMLISTSLVKVTIGGCAS